MALDRPVRQLSQVICPDIDALVEKAKSAKPVQAMLGRDCEFST